jgi:hypothetical protein
MAESRGAWLIAGLRPELVRWRRKLHALEHRSGVPEDVRRRGSEAIRAVIDEIGVQIRGLEYGWDDDG